MATPLLEQRKKLRKLIPVLAVVILITAFNVWRGFFSEPKTSLLQSELPIAAKKIEIDWEVVKSQQLENLDLFREISPLENKAGRANPFEPY